MSVPTTLSVISVVCLTILADALPLESYGTQILSCPQGCICHETKLICTDLISDHIPRNTREVVLSNPTNKTLIQGAFCNTSWPSVTKLTLNSTTEEIYLADNVFDCLDQLDVLKIQNENNALRFYNQSFAGLTNVSVLDLTGCPRIDSDEFYRALSD